MNAKTLITLLIVNCIIIVIVLGTFRANATQDAVLTDAQRPETVREDDYSTEAVQVVMDENLPFDEYMDDIKEGLSFFSPQTIQQFNEDGWRIIITKTLDFKDSPYFRSPVDERNKIYSLVNIKTKTLQIRERKDEADYIRDQTVFVMCQFIDYMNGFLSSQDEFTDIICEYPEYREYRYVNVELTKENEEILNAPMASVVDYFAYTMRDYLMSPEYTAEYYPDMFDYYIERFSVQKKAVKEK